MIILITGIEESGRDDITDMVLQGCKSALPSCMLLKAADTMPDFSTERSFNKLTAMRDNAISKLEKQVILALKKGGNIIISAGITKKTVYGYLPVLTGGFMDTIKPDMIIFMEVVPHHVESYMEHEHIDWSYQRMERQLSILFSMRTGAVLRMMKVKSGKIKDVIKEASDLFKALMA